MKWNNIDTIPKTGEEVLVCNIKQGSVLSLIRWNEIYKTWQCKGVIIESMQADCWTRIDKPKTKLDVKRDNGE